MDIYVGMKEHAKPKIFESEIAPTKETSPEYDFTYGPFKTVEDAQRYLNAMDRGVACSEG